jgi:hypothetical protein
LVSSTIQMNFFAQTSTIFSRSSVPPPPLMRQRSGSTASAPSIATSKDEFSFSVQSGIPQPTACSRVRSCVGMQTMFASSPVLSFCPTRSTAKYAIQRPCRSARAHRLPCTWRSHARVSTAGTAQAGIQAQHRRAEGVVNTGEYTHGPLSAGASYPAAFLAASSDISAGGRKRTTLRSSSFVPMTSAT